MSEKREARALYVKARDDAREKYRAFKVEAASILAKSKEIAAEVYDSGVAWAWMEYEKCLNTAWEVYALTIMEIEKQEETDHD